MNNPYLSDNFTPVQDELEIKKLEVIGEIPQNLVGVYMRNGPNPQFEPLSYTYPFDGDGMIHAVYLADGQATYRNRFVETNGLLKERKAGKALYGGVLQPMPMDPQWADPEEQPVAFKNGAFIHIIRHAQNYLALGESAPAYQINAQLHTLGEWAPIKNQAPIDVGAHTRFDPLTGELWFVNYSIMPPFLSFYRFDKKGQFLKKYDIDKPHCSMIHDFVLTQNYVLVFDCPIILDMQKMATGGDILSWQPELGVRLGVMSRKSGKMRWFDTEPFFVFHFANAYEQGDELIIDYVRHEKIVLLEEAQNKTPPMLARTCIDLKQGHVKHTMLAENLVEFPRIREDRNSLAHRFIYLPTKTTDNQNKRTFNALLKYDTHKQQTEIHHFGVSAEIGEAVFAPATTQKSEDDGYLLLFVYESTTKQSEFVILDAQNMTKEPLARVKMPRRIPHGLHGSWMPEIES